jgi:hypothetical protein
MSHLRSTCAGRTPLVGALLLAAAVTAAMATEQQQPGVFKAGAATSNITPPLGTSINGNMRDVRAGHVHDELHARCLVLDDGATRLAFAVVDCCMLPRSVTDAARKYIEAEVGIPASHVLISATHSHSTGTCTSVFQSDPDGYYPPFVARRIADGVRRAVNNLEPAKAGWGFGAVPDEVFVRRWRMRPGAVLKNPFGGVDQVKMNPGVGNPDLVEPAGVPDPELSILSAVSVAGRPIGVLANYGLHYVGGVGAGHVSADYFGMFAEGLKQRLNAERSDPPFVAAMSNGASGDVNNINFRVPAPRLGAYEKMRAVAVKVASEAARVHGTIRHSAEIRLGARETELRLGVRKASGDELGRARALLADLEPGTVLSDQERIYAREALKLSEYPDEVPVILQAFKIGDLGIAAIPCEVFAEIGLALKRESAVRPMFVVSLANGYNGYLPTPEQHALGGYETWRARSSYLEVNASRKISTALLDLFRQLAAP